MTEDPCSDADLDVEVAAAAQAAARLAQERTQKYLRRVAALTAVVLVALSTATLVYVVLVSGATREAADEARRSSEGNSEILQAFRKAQAENAAASQAAREASEQRLREALETLRAQEASTDARRTAQIQALFDALVAEVRDPENREGRGRVVLDADDDTPPPSRPEPGDDEPPPPPPPSPSPSPSPTCATGAPVLGVCLRPPPARLLPEVSP